MMKENGMTSQPISPGTAPAPTTQNSTGGGAAMSKGVIAALDGKSEHIGYEHIAYMVDVLTLFAPECCDDICWQTVEPDDTGPIWFYVLCNDVFWWGTADAEKIELSDVADLALCFKRVKEMTDGCPYDAGTLWAAQKRRMRPQGAMYKYLDQRLHPLFDACGPERTVELGNPKAHPSTTQAE